MPALLFDFHQLDNIDPTPTTYDDQLLHHCAICGHELTIVRPGKWQCDNCEAAMAAQMSETDIISTDAIPFNDAPEIVGCAFGGGRSDELPEIPMENAIAVLHRISEWISKIEMLG